MTMRFLSPVAVAVRGIALVATAACGADVAKGTDATNADVRAKIAARLDIKLEDIKPSPVPGLYEVASGSDVGYVSEDGRFYIDGDLYDMESQANLTEERRAAGRGALLKAVRDADTVVFAGKDHKYTLDVFTDMDCGYCRKLHSEIAELNRLGVRVRYLMYPRGGPGSSSWKKAEAVMCSANRNDALTRAKRGEEITAKPCANPVAAQYALGRDLGIRGTPGIFTEQGDYITGYLPAAKLVERLKALQDKS
jgi:thiol:disulfide interchange protein DsbC